MRGVSICEAAAQFCSFNYDRATNADQFLGFGGRESVKFRGEVGPGAKLSMVAKNLTLGKRRASFQCQGFVDGRMVFGGIIIGIAM